MKRIGHFFFRGVILLCWTGLIFGLLFLPKERALTDAGEKSITLFSWSDMFSAEDIKAFENETGIKVHLNYYSSNEELIVKLKATKGQGYDLILPSDYAVRILKNESLIKRIDTQKISAFKDIAPALKNLPFDEGNAYSIPYSWEVYGLVYDPIFFKDRPFTNSWSMLFDPKQVDYTIAMVNDPVEAFIFTAYYKYGPVDWLTKEQLKSVEHLLSIQKNWIEAYGAMRPDYFVSMKNCPIGICSSSYGLLAQSEFPFLEFGILRPNTFVSIENFCIPEASNKDAYVYEFINFMMRPEILAKSSEKYCFFPPCEIAFDYMLSSPPSFKKTYTEALEIEDSFHFVKNITDEETMRLFWINLKAL